MLPVDSSQSMKRKASFPISPVPYGPGNEVGCSMTPAHSYFHILRLHRKNQINSKFLGSFCAIKVSKKTYFLFVCLFYYFTTLLIKIGE